MLVLSCQEDSGGATTVARMATLAEIALPSEEEEHQLQEHQWQDPQQGLQSRLSRGEEATGLRRQAEYLLCQEQRQQAQVTWLWVVV